MFTILCWATFIAALGQMHPVRLQVEHTKQRYGRMKHQEPRRLGLSLMEKFLFSNLALSFLHVKKKKGGHLIAQRMT